MYLGVDFGDSRTGIAISDELLLMAHPLCTIFEKSTKRVVQQIQQIVGEKQITKVIVGLPLNMNGSLGERGEITRFFALKLQKRLLIPVEFYDERLSTKIAAQSLQITNSKNVKNLKDSVAACVILQGYMDSLKKLKNKKVEGKNA